MKERISRFLRLPFYMGCWDRGVEVKGTKGDQTKPSTMEGESSSSSSMVKGKKPWVVAPSRADISKVVDMLIKSTFKSVTRIFAYKDFEDIESETETELEIGLPTDVKHVTHIGYDGSVTTNPDDKNWDHFQPPETLSLEQLIGLQKTKVEKQDP
ncbi:hypothetical protein M8C21_017645 [Ambrosia artemisiifolia]|uniref:CRIB domain-containing protein n=1 Tax=Ambrosia artemisiifolia TaxID=4212 RepID=A0AAD5CJE3_AMBAR|nr:hypothetical protein M8C21_017645 [Ambrosia artemisiifolia]